MKSRVITAVVAAASLLALLFILPDWVFELALVAFLGISLYETYRVLETGGHAPVRWTGYCFAVLMWPAYRFLGISGVLFAMALTMLATLLTELWRKKPSYQDLAFTAFVFFYPCLPFATAFALRDAIEGVAGTALLLLALAVAFAGDTFALFAGKFFGKRKLCPTVSAKKTVEGAIGGLAGSIIGGVTVYYLFPALGGAIPLWLVLVMSVVGGFASQVGDLTASLIKRYAGVKDYGTFFPGHGGVMDRLDGALLSVLVTFLVFSAYIQL